MASFNYMNNTAPFWDFIASLEQQGSNHPFFGQNGQGRSNDNEQGEGHEGHHQPRPEGSHPPQFDPWSWGHQAFGGLGGLSHRGPPPPPFPPARPCSSTPPPPPPPGPPGPPHHDEHNGEKDGERSDNDNDNDNGEDPSGSGSDRECRNRPDRHGRCGSRRGRHGFGGRGGCGPHGGPGRHGPRGHHGPAHGGLGRGPHGHHGPPHEGHFGGPHDQRGPHHHGGPGRRGPWGHGGPYGGPGSFENAFCVPALQRDAASLFAPLWEAFTAQHASNQNNDTTKKDNEDFTPEADIFDTPSAYIIHISLPGAKKEDVGVNWDAEKSELSIAGVIYRPGDEEFLKTLAMNERKVGPFERKIRLGSRANPAHVDADGIIAKLEDGVLRVEVRKEDEGFVEIKKVDIE